jgi:zinc protease
MKNKIQYFGLSLVIAVSLTLSPAVQANTPEVTEPPKVEAAPQKAEEQPWLYEGSDIPVDKSWTFGKLDNGVRYAVKRNLVPAGQVSIRVRIDAGALHENDDELGFAHLIEHLSFRGSTFVPDGEAKRIWQRFGVTFGSDSNAQTTPTHTVYKLDLPGAEAARLDESMKIISGMIREPRISPAALAAERDIVLAELRENDGASLRYSNALRSHIFQQQRLGERPTIGTPETLRAASAEKLAAFHKRWYRPENTVVILAGDADPETLATSIKQHFSGWKGEGLKALEPDFGKPAPGKDAALIAEPTLPTTATLAWLRPWFLKNDTIVYNEGLLGDALAVQIINRRLESAARDGSSYIFAEVSQDDMSRSANATFVSITPIADKWEEAVKDVRAVIADAVKIAPSQADISREKTLFANALRTGVDSYPFEAASKQADDIISAVDIRETVAAPQTVVDVFAAMDSKLTPEWLLERTKGLFDGAQARIFLATPLSQQDGEKRLAAALTAPVEANAQVRLAESKATFDDLPKLGKPGTIAKSEPFTRFEMETITLSNGTKALLYPNQAETGQIRMVVRFGRGYQAFTPQNGGLLWTGQLVLGENGVGKLKRADIDQMTSGRRIGLDFSIDADAFQFASTTRTDDLYDQLRLIAAKLEHPGWADAPVERAKALARSGYDSFEMTASSVLQRDLDYLIRGGDQRWKSAGPQEIAKVTPAAFRKFWEPLLAQGPVEVMIFGDFKREDAVKALTETLGAMRQRKAPMPSVEALRQRFPAGGSAIKTLTHKGPADQVAAVVAWPTGGGLARVTESRQLEVLAAIFRDRLFEKFRAEQAASYSPDMANSWPLEFPEGGYLMAYTQVRPQDVGKFYAFADEVAKDLKSTPVSDDELKRAVEPIKQYIDRASSGNTFWLQNLKGAASNPGYFKALGHLYSDFSNVTAAGLQALAQRYFRDDTAWKLTVQPEGQGKNSAVNTAAR